MITLRALLTHHFIVLPALAIALTLSFGSPAADVFRCIAEDGSVLFSETPCGPEAEHRSYQGSAPLSGSEAPPDSPQQQLRRYQQGVEEIEKLIGREQSKPQSRKSRSSRSNCNGVTRLQLRNARVSKRIIKCHKKQDVQSVLGAPDRVETFSDRKSYDSRWTYYSDNGNQKIFFQNGVVVRINTSEYKKD